MIISGGQAEQERGSSMGNKIFKTANLRKTVNYLKKNGLRHTWYAAKERIGEEKKSFYVYREPSGEELAAQQAGTMDYSELFSIIVPAYETKETFLRELIDSVRRQSYQNWELIIADAGSSDGVEKTVRKILEETEDRRIKYSRLAENKGISCNTNEGIVQASGDYIALLDHDDWLTPDALYHMASTVHRSRQRGIAPVLLYSDEDKYDNNKGYFFTPNIKERFNFDLILSNNYICHFMAVEAAVMKNLLLRQEDRFLRPAAARAFTGRRYWTGSAVWMKIILLIWKISTLDIGRGSAVTGIFTSLRRLYIMREAEQAAHGTINLKWI